MADTTVTIRNEGNVLAPSQSSVPVKEGDSVTFKIAASTPATLLFSPDAARALKPSPTGPATIPPDGTLSYSFTTSSEGAYSVYLETGSDTPQRDFPLHPSGELQIKVDASNVSFGANIGVKTSGI